MSKLQVNKTNRKYLIKWENNEKNFFSDKGTCYWEQNLVSAVMISKNKTLIFITNDNFLAIITEEKIV